VSDRVHHRALANDFAVGIGDDTPGVAHRRLGADTPTRGRGLATGRDGAVGEQIDATPEPPDDTLISRINFPTRIQNVSSAAGLRIVGDVREASDHMVPSLPDLGQGSVNIFATRWVYRRRNERASRGRSMSDEDDWEFAGDEDAKMTIRATDPFDDDAPGG
jgi:hypothetical protein